MIDKIKMSENSIMFRISFHTLHEHDKIPGISESITHHTIVYRHCHNSFHGPFMLIWMYEI